MSKIKIKNIGQVIEYLNSIDYYSNKTEENVKNIFLQNIKLYSQSKITKYFLAALCSELLYFEKNISAFKDANLRNALLKGDELSSMFTLNIEDEAKEKFLIQTILKYLSI